MADVSMGGGGQQSPAGEPSLERVMGPWLLLLFIVGDILGTGIYALTGNVANHVGGVVWLPFLVAFVVALLTAFSYLELVTKYPRAAGAALYTHKAFGIHFVTFIVAFAVMCSGITSASTASRAFAANFAHAFNLNLATGIGITVIGLLFMAAVAIVNFRGVGESVKANVVVPPARTVGAGAEPLPLASATSFVLAPEDPARNVAISSTVPIGLYAGRDQARPVEIGERQVGILAQDRVRRDERQVGRDLEVLVFGEDLGDRPRAGRAAAADIVAHRFGDALVEMPGHVVLRQEFERLRIAAAHGIDQRGVDVARIGVDRRCLLPDRERLAGAVVDRPSARRDLDRLALLLRGHRGVPGAVDDLDPGGAPQRDREEADEREDEEADAGVGAPVRHGSSRRNVV